MQAIYFTWILSLWESRYAAGMSIGQVDRYLFPFFETDIRQGGSKSPSYKPFEYRGDMYRGRLVRSGGEGPAPILCAISLRPIRSWNTLGFPLPLARWFGYSGPKDTAAIPRSLKRFSR